VAFTLGSKRLKISKATVASRSGCRQPRISLYSSRVSRLVIAQSVSVCSRRDWGFRAALVLELDSMIVPLDKHGRAATEPFAEGFWNILLGENAQGESSAHEQWCVESLIRGPYFPGRVLVIFVNFVGQL
jgi:hypothetical protein